MSESLRIHAYETLGALEDLLPAWEELLSQIPSTTIFNTWEWLAPWWRAFGKERNLVVLAFHNSSQKLVGLAPLSLSTLRISPGVALRLLQLMGDGSGDSDNLDVLVCPGYEAEVARLLLEYLSEHKHRWDVCALNTLPFDSPAANRLLAHLKELGWPYAVYHHPCSAIVLPDSWESYLNQISKKERDKLDYYLRRVEKRYQACFFKCTRESELSVCLENLFELHQKRWKLLGEPGSFRSPERRQFYRDMAKLLLARRRLEFWLLSLDRKAVAAQFTFRYNNTVFALQEGFDPEYSTDSVGYVLRGYAIRQLIADGVRRYDFLGGQNPGKDRWGAQTGTYLHVHFARPFCRGSAYLRLANTSRIGKEWLRSHLPSPVWGALRSIRHRFGGNQLRPVQESTR